MTEKPEVMKAALGVTKFKRPLLYAATAGNLAAMGALAKESGLPLAVKAGSVADLIPLTQKLTEMGLKTWCSTRAAGRSNRPTRT